jgi:hypothetical protein
VHIISRTRGAGENAKCRAPKAPYGIADGLTLHPITEEMRQLSERCVQAGVFTAIMVNDAVHVAAAVLTRQDLLLSWNFKHLVNRFRRAKINQVNVSQGLPTIEIIAPPEI